MTMRSDQSSNPGPDPFTGFWTDWVSKMAAAGFAPPSQPTQEDLLKQMRQAFFDAWAKHCDEFMRSDIFLEAMKKSMDGALAFQRQLNELMTRTLHTSQMPARSDTDSILLVLRSFEERVLERMEDLNHRIEELETKVGGGTSSPGPGHGAGTVGRKERSGGRA